MAATSTLGLIIPALGVTVTTFAPGILTDTFKEYSLQSNNFQWNKTINNRDDNRDGEYTFATYLYCIDYDDALKKFCDIDTTDDYKYEDEFKVYLKGKKYFKSFYSGISSDSNSETNCEFIDKTVGDITVNELVIKNTADNRQVTIYDTSSKQYRPLSLADFGITKQKGVESLTEGYYTAKDSNGNSLWYKNTDIHRLTWSNSLMLPGNYLKSGYR